MSDTAHHPHQPKIARKMIVRFGIGLALAAILFIGLAMVNSAKDVDLPASAETKATLAALKVHEDGQQAVLIKPDGAVVLSPGYKIGASDRDLIWRPDGNRLTFVSDREGSGHVFRWNPAANRVERRSIATGSYNEPTYLGSDRESNARPIAVYGGEKIVEFDPVAGVLSPILPPSSDAGSTGEAEEGRTGWLERSAYGRFGSNFRKAQFVGGRRWLAMVMRGERGETLVLQDLEPVDGQLKPPAGVAAGDHVEFIVNPLAGEIIFCVQAFRVPDLSAVPKELIKDGKVKLPNRHMVGVLNPESARANLTLIASENDKIAFGSPALSADGSKLALTAGPYDRDGHLTVSQIIVLALGMEVGSSPSVIRQGDAHGLTWNPDGKSMAFVTRDGKAGIHLIDADGSNERTLVEGSFRQPQYSPQQ